MELIQQATPFDHDEWLFEVKHDGFRSLAYIENRICKLVSRNDFDYKRFRALAQVMPSQINAKNAILDGELVVLDSFNPRATAGRAMDRSSHRYLLLLVPKVARMICEISTP